MNSAAASARRSRGAKLRSSHKFLKSIIAAHRFGDCKNYL
jgi:hypothetical protein